MNTTPPVQPAQEPVVWLTKNKFSDEIHFDEKNAKETTGWSAAFPVYTTPQPAQERNFCPRCGKRTADLTVIHTCTPPQENT